MRSYNLIVNEKLKNILLSYTECKKVYIDNNECINQLLKESVSDDKYHLYEYNNSVNFLIKSIKVENDKIENMVVYLLSNDLEKINKLYLKIQEQMGNVCYINYNIKENDSCFFDDSIGIIKNYENCIRNKEFLLSDVRRLNNITKLELKNDDYYLGGNKYLNKNDYRKYVNEYFDKKNNEILYATLKHVGKYDTIYETYEKLLSAINEENKKIVGLPMEKFIFGRWNEKDESKYVTNIMIPILI